MLRLRVKKDAVDDVKHLEMCGIRISRMRSLAVGRGRTYVRMYVHDLH